MDNFTINLTNKILLPDIDYINELAEEKGFVFGKNFSAPPKILEDLFYLFTQENKNSLTFNVKEHLFGSEIIESDVLFKEMTKSQDAYYNYTLVFLSEIEYDAVLGLTPMDKSLNVLMYLTHLSKKNTKNDVTNDPNPGDHTIQSEEDLAEAIKDASQGIETMGTGQENDQQELSKEITKCVRDFLDDLTPEIVHIYGKNRPADVKINRKILNDIKIKSYLENTKGMETADQREMKRNNNSSDIERVNMETHAQITKTNKQAMALPTFDDKFIKKELVVKEKVVPETKKQILYMLLDDSGSMCCEVKQTYVRAVLLNRLESVVKGNAELKFCLYENRRYMHYDIKNKADAQKLFRTISVRRPGGGGTNIGAVLQQTIDEIHNLPDHVDPEIMIVCDGDDLVYHDDVDPKGVRMSAILLGRSNPGIEILTEKTGGFYSVEKLYH